MLKKTKNTGLFARHWLIATALAVVIAPATVHAQASTQYDVLIRGGRLLDGTGTPWRYADVAIKGDRIVVVGPIPADAKATQVIDARGKYVTPGFIDPHSHAAPEPIARSLGMPGTAEKQEGAAVGIQAEPLAAAAPLLYQGITTLFINPDGGGPADLRSQVAAIERVVPGVNVAPMIGHNAVRAAVLGSADRTPNADEQQRMEALMRAAMQLGAFGLSSGPFYVPGKYSKTEEIIGLAKVAAEFPHAFHTSHIRDESSYDIGVVGAVDELIRVSREAHLPGIVTHIKALGPSVWGKSQEIIAQINAARAEGLEIWADQYPYTASGSNLQASLVPGWAQAGGQKALAERLKNPAQRARIRQEMAINLERRAGAHNIMIRRYPTDPAHEGKRLDEIADAHQQDPLDTAIEMLIHGGAAIVSFNMSDKDVDLFMQQPWTMTCTDGELVELGSGSPHPRAYGTFPRKIRRYALDRGVITLEQAVHASTGMPASVFGVPDRGELRPGAYADVLIFDPAKILDTATYEQPHAYAQGMEYVFVNGRAAIAQGKLAPQRFGRVLLRTRP